MKLNSGERVESDGYRHSSFTSIRMWNKLSPL